MRQLDMVLADDAAAPTISEVPHELFHSRLVRHGALEALDLRITLADVKRFDADEHGKQLTALRRALIAGAVTREHYTAEIYRISLAWIKSEPIVAFWGSIARLHERLTLGRGVPILSGGEVAGCERRTWHPDTNQQGRCWVCTPDEGEELCEWCRDEEWHRYNDELMFNHRMRLERAAQDAGYGFVGQVSLADVPDQVVPLVVDMGSPETAVQAIVSHLHSYSHESSDELWSQSHADAIRHWESILAEVREAAPTAESP
jgi:hypothetical protein